MSHEHSQLPWRHDPENPGLVLAYATDEDGRAVTVSDSVDPDDAEFIVHACNSHDDLFRQATKAAKQAEKMRAALGNIIERAQEIRDENSGDKCAMDASDIETMARAALESKEPQQRTATVGNQPDSDDVKAATPRATEAHTLAPGLGCASEVREPSGAEQSISRTPATFRDNGSRGDFPAEGELATLHPSGQNKPAGSPDSRKRHE